MKETVSEDYDLGFEHGCKLACGIETTSHAKGFTLIDQIREQLLKENQTAHLAHLDKVCKDIDARNRAKT